MGDLILKRVEDRAGKGRVAFLTVNNPDKRNALGMAGKQQIAAAFNDLSRDAALRAVVITGAGERSFIAGADIHCVC